MKDKRVNMFVCGPTVYDYSHIGHARTYLAFDVIARYLRCRDYSVFYIMNITDVDDKIIKRAKENKEKAEEVAEKFTDYFLEDMSALKIEAMNFYGKATEHVPEIIEQIEGLIKRGYAYEAKGDVYFEIKKFKDFGKLSGQKLGELKAGARVEVDPNKKNPEDFVLWKKHKEGEPSWNSPWGKGRPGWHIEDTAISISYFNEQYDLHGGARDLIFPHHESEIAIAESLTGKKPFVKYWLHSGYLNITGEKMSKSLGNIISIRDLLKKYDAMTIRFFLLYTHYRSPIDFSYEQLEEAKEAYQYIKNTVQKLRNLQGGGGKKDKELLSLAKKTKEKFLKAMDDDFNTREAMARLFDFTREVNKGMEQTSSKTIEKILALYQELGEDILGLTFQEAGETDLADQLMRLIISLRDEARKKKDFATSDKIRDELKKAGITLEDGKKGTNWLKK